MLQVRNLAIDVAARRVLTDASFTVAAGDKVGLVGRNGAGKTSLLKVLAGEDDAAAGIVLKRGTLGYVPQNPRPRAEAAQTVLSHILSGRGLDRAALRLDMPAVLSPFDTIVEPEAARRWLGERIRGDFGIGAIIDVDDWRLSRTEVGACVLAMGGV